MRDTLVATPVLKWAGGKRQLLPEILPRLPDFMETYYEPFVGGGAVFFALAEAKRFRRAVLSDRNDELIAVYKAIQSDVEGLIAILKRMRHDEETYYEVRQQRPRTLLRKAARVIYLNKTGYNGLYRVNSKGEFNVPFGRHLNPAVCDATRLRHAARVLENVELVSDDFSRVVEHATPADGVYFDPPYLPVSETARFTYYDRHSFQLADHHRLTDCFATLAARGVPVLLSNSDTPTTRELYARWDTVTVQATRLINRNATGRGLVSELLVSGVPHPSLP